MPADRSIPVNTRSITITTDCAPNGNRYRIVRVRPAHSPLAGWFSRAASRLSAQVVGIDACLGRSFDPGAFVISGGGRIPQLPQTRSKRCS
jgi:hypothetical protein